MSKQPTLLTYAPYAKLLTYKKMQKGDVKETHASILETVNYTNYKPSKKIEDGIQEFVSWYKKFKY